MDKSIVIISGEQHGKKKFNKIARERCFVRNVNVFNQIQDKTKKFIVANNECEVEDQYCRYENQNIGEQIERFQQDDSEEKTVSIGECIKTFTKSLLVLHWISPELTEGLKESEGAMQLHIASSDSETNIENYDIVLYEDTVDFIEKVDKFLDAVLNCNTQKENK
jgi:hypothetical protein